MGWKRAQTFCTDMYTVVPRNDTLRVEMYYNCHWYARRTQEKSSWRAVTLCFLLLQVIASAPSTRADEVCDIGSRLELFVDDYLIDRLDGAEQRLHRPQAANKLLEGKQPSGLWFDNGYAVVKDGNIYRMFYNASSVLALAESLDGIHWTTPSIGLVEYNGSRDNNLVGTEDGRLMISDQEPLPEVFLDTRPGVAADERYKALTLDETKGVKVFAWVSGDARRFRKLREEPILHTDLYGAFDGYEAPFSSESEQCYLIYLRYYIRGETEAENRRSIARMRSKDFLTWSDPEPMTFGDTGLKPAEHHYNNQTDPYFRAPHIYLALSSRFMQGRQVVSRKQADAAGLKSRLLYKGDAVDWLIGDCSETVLMTTRGGTHYDRTFMEALVRPGPGRRNWVTRSNFALRGVVPTGEREMSIYVSRHNTQDSGHIRRYTLRTDGFASIYGRYAGGEMVTRPLVFSGRKLMINYSTSAAGSLRVELQGEDGKALSGFGLEQCDEIVGDEISRVVRWQSKSDVGPFAGRPVRLRFSMMDADLFSIQFVD